MRARTSPPGDSNAHQSLRTTANDDALIKLVAPLHFLSDTGSRLCTADQVQELWLPGAKIHSCLLRKLPQTFAHVFSSN